LSLAITIDDFAKLDLRAGRILAAETVKGSDKLLKLVVDLGRENRSVFAGIKESYQPEALVGKTVVVVAKLKPRKMRFGMRRGMVLVAVGKDGKVTVCELAGSVPAALPPCPHPKPQTSMRGAAAYSDNRRDNHFYEPCTCKVASRILRTELMR
jgi:methionine--tRNA ligase beta chain